MIRSFRHAPDGGLVEQAGLPPRLGNGIVWIDLLSPDPQENAALEALLGFAIPSLEDMREIEVSSRLFVQSDAAFMTASVPARGSHGRVATGPVTFILAGDILITLRYHAPRSFATIARRVERLGLDCDSGAAVMVALLEAIIDNLADTLEDAGKDIEALTGSVLEEDPPGASRGGLQAVLRGIGRADDSLAKAADSLTTLTRLVGFLTQHLAAGLDPAPFAHRLETIARDLHSLSDHAGFLSGKVAFQLDATLGMINIEQNNIMKIFTMMSVVLLPPTLIGSIYGMNFHWMPELSWPWGYPLALLAMLVSALVPYYYFRYRGWL